MRELLGAFLMVLPFIVLGVYIAREDGTTALVFVACFVAVAVGAVVLGSHLLFGGAA